MKIILSVTDGPHKGKEFTFDGHDTFLVGRVKDAHLQLSYDDPYFSRRHFVLEVNPPRCRLMDFKSRNGTHVNGERVSIAEIKQSKTSIMPQGLDASLSREELGDVIAFLKSLH